MSQHPEPSTGWEAQPPPDPPVPAEQEERDSRLDRLLAHQPEPQPEPQPQPQPQPEPESRAERSEPEPAPATEAAPDEPVPSALPADDWRELQLQFVDDPEGAVGGALRLVRAAVEAQAGAHDHGDTEQLRQAFTRLRDLHARLTG